MLALKNEGRANGQQSLSNIYETLVQNQTIKWKHEIHSVLERICSFASH